MIATIITDTLIAVNLVGWPFGAYLFWQTNPDGSLRNGRKFRRQLAEDAAK